MRETSRRAKARIPRRRRRPLWAFTSNATNPNRGWRTSLFRDAQVGCLQIGVAVFLVGVYVAGSASGLSVLIIAIIAGLVFLSKPSSP